MLNWHRLFGLFLIDYFTNSPYVVELEKDLSIKQQFLDVVVLRKEPGQFNGQLPDGLDNLAIHNLLTYKSLHEPLDDWALKELTGHYVNYRKQVSPGMNDLLAESEFQLFAVSTRFPQKLSQMLALQPVSTGVYDVPWYRSGPPDCVVRDPGRHPQCSVALVQRQARSGVAGAQSVSVAPARPQHDCAAVV